MSSFINAQHLKVMLGQESPVGKAWADYYGPQMISRGMMILPFAIEQFYPQTGASEWELAVIRMIISCSDLRDGPMACFDPQDFASRFHLSLRQIRRKFKTMVEKGLIIITPLYGEQGSKITSRLYDCNPFLDKIFTCLCADEDWQQQQNEILDSIGIDEDFDDLDMLSTIDEDPVSATDHLSHPPSVPTSTERTSMSLPASNCIGTSMSLTPVSSTGTDLSLAQMSSERTSMSPDDVAPSTASPTSYVCAHTHIHAPDSNSSSNSNINTCINILETDPTCNSCVNHSETYSSSSSNSNSNHDASDLSDLFADEDFNAWLRAKHPVESPYLDEVRMPFDDSIFVQTSDKDDDPSRFECRLLDAIGVARPPYDDPYRTVDEEPVCINPVLDAKLTKAVRQQFAVLRQEYEASKLANQASGQVETAQAEAVSDEQVQQQEQIQHQALEQSSGKRIRRLLTLVETTTDESIEPFEPDDAVTTVHTEDKSLATSTSEPPIPTPTVADREMPVLLQGHSRTAIYHISNDLHDASPHSSRAQARTLYNQLLIINQTEDEYSMSDPDLYFSDLMRTVKYAIRNKTFKSRNHDGHPNGMPLFFHELKKRVEDQVATVEELRQEGNYQSMYHERRKIASALDTINSSLDSSQDVASDFIRQHKAAQETAQLSLTNAQIVEHARRLQLPMSDAEADSMLDNSAPELLIEQLTTGVRLALYYEIIDK